ncbi:MAG: DUF4215 domain-containing protein [Deltaproteobacteria bacterium]|jgi:cysteine-rich repeat protein|nr:DUF4215 domain-containing protein [Deltaproteobacteria bacterium]
MLKSGIVKLLLLIVLLALVGCAEGSNNEGTLCGNQVIDENEECDDGNQMENDGCSSDCQIEIGWVCEEEPSICEDSCGNGTIESGEDCDDNGESFDCNSNCTLSRCGDEIVNTTAGEDCDDGQETEECSANCQSKACGNGIIDSGEDCDDAGESATCNANCTQAECGDGIVNSTAGEDCDESEATETCSDQCTIPNCGDDIIDVNEDCDDGGESATCNSNCTQAECGDGILNLTAGEDCDGAGETVTCNANCTEAICGDGIINSTAGEDCDDNGESAACNTDCSISVCGDSIVNTSAGEECDDGNTNNSDSCDNNCQNNISPTCNAPMTTLYANNNGFGGAMFDVVSRKNITITHFDTNLDTGTREIEIYYKLGTHEGYETNSGAWIYLGSTSVSGMGIDIATSIPIYFSVYLPTNTRAAFYIISTTSGMKYTSGSTLGALHSANTDLEFYEGTGTSDTLWNSSFFSPRIFNGTIYYNCN